MKRPLTAFEIKKIIRIIGSWSENKLSWKGLCNSIQQQLGLEITRQGLNNHKVILDVYQNKKRFLRESQTNKQQSESSLLNENEALRIKKLRIQKEIDQLVEFQLTLMANINGGVVIVPAELIFGESQ